MILVVNPGSSSIKFKLFNEAFEVLVEGLAERIGIDGALTLITNEKKHKFNTEFPDHLAAAETIIEKLRELNIVKNQNEIKSIGLRVVHGGDKIFEPVIIDSRIKKIIEINSKLAPLHNPPALVTIEAFEKTLSHAKLVACFDTAFHQSIKPEKFLYPVPYEWYEKNSVRRYGMHGISYAYIVKKFREVKQLKNNDFNLIIAHLGNGASITSIKNGKSFNTSMGLTPLDGLMMGTRSGEIDPSIIEYISKDSNMDVIEVTSILNKDSGLKGISGISSDMRDITSVMNENTRAKLAVDMYCQRVADFVIKYLNQLEGKIDGLIFTAGIGENSFIIREEIIKKLPMLNIELDSKSNIEQYDECLKISTNKSQYEVFKIRTNEELMICKDVIKLTK
ncbi:acetate kinase [Spiroplasma sp. TIUS-1]|uniref:acetate kinase n=1 Tax=Spiroplasma sp. TIUS-1 TaxID=216963 RepID=UPI001396DCEC|nr:acetate kinase [Spiroplasma sp. TIUS-1]QHX35660.1 acetate kinase [Spiroplasma sp. TIUS-1]